GVYQKRAYVLLPDGARLKFTENANGTYTPPLGRYDTLVKNADGTFDITLQHSLAKIHFGGTGYASSIWDDYGNRLSISNGATGTKVQQISDLSGSGRFLTITWGGDGRIATIGDSSGRVVSYTYTGDGALETVTHVDVTPGVDQTTTFIYNQGRFG